MPRSRRLPALVAFSDRTTKQLTVFPTALLALLASVTTIAGAQVHAASDTPLHVPASRFEFVVSSDTQSSTKPLVVHNGGTARLTDVRLTRLAYADSARGAAWLVVLPRKSAVAPDELATV